MKMSRLGTTGRSRFVGIYLNPLSCLCGTKMWSRSLPGLRFFGEFLRPRPAMGREADLAGLHTNPLG